MSTLTVYDAQGNEYSPTGTATGTNQRMKEMALASMRIAIKPTERQVTGYFRAKETPNSRAEQFYGEYTDRNTAEPLTDFVDAVRTQIDEWNQTLAESDDSMSVFNALTNQRRTTVPGSEMDKRILEELAGDREVTAVGVSGANEAIGLLQEFADQHSVAIADSTNTDALSEFDIVIVTGRHQGIEPLGQTTGQWKEAKQSLKRELVSEEISSITESVRTLKRDFGLSSGEIQRKVSGLEASSSGGRGGSQLGGSASTGERIKQTLLSPKVGKYLFIGSIVLILLIGGAVLLGGGIPFIGSGGGGIISGTVYDESGDAVSGASITLENSTTDKEIKQTTTESDGTYEFNTTDTTGPYAVRYNGTVNDVEDGGTANFNEPGILSNLPFISNNDTGDDGSAEDDESNRDDESSGDGGETSDNGNQEQAFRVLNGTVQDSNGDPVSFANVTIEYGDGDALTEEQETEEDGQYRFEDVPYEGDIQNITLVWKASEEGYTQEDPPEVDLGELYENEEEGIERGITLTQES